jgi:hypothetical protein
MILLVSGKLLQVDGFTYMGSTRFQDTFAVFYSTCIIFVGKIVPWDLPPLEKVSRGIDFNIEKRR